MERIPTPLTTILDPREAEVEYIFDMIAELAKLARRTGEVGTAIYLEAILAARRAMSFDEAG